MTYEQFKKELYRNVLRQARLWGKTVELMEKGTECRDTGLARTLDAMKGIDGNGGSRVVREDMLLVMTQEFSDTRAVREKTPFEWNRKEDECGYSGMMRWEIRPLYDRFKREGWQSVLPEIAVKLQERENGSDRPPCLGEGYEKNSGKLILRPLNFVGNREELANGVYWRFGDIALVLYILLYDMDVDLMTMKISLDMIEKWGVTSTEALMGALLNTYVKMPPRLYYGTDIRMEYGFQEGSFMKEEGGKPIEIHGESQDEGLRGYRLTTSRWLNGAVALFYPGVKERLAELMEGDYYVGFTSIHEAVIHPVRHKILGEMKAAIQHTNAVFDRREMLTNCVYRYCCAKGGLIEV